MIQVAISCLHVLLLRETSRVTNNGKMMSLKIQ